MNKQSTYVELRDALSLAIGVIELMQKGVIAKDAVASRLDNAKRVYDAALPARQRAALKTVAHNTGERPSPEADLVRMAAERGLTPAQFAELVRRMNYDKAAILTVIEGL